MPQYQISVPGQGTFRVDSPTELTDLQAWQAVQSQLTAGPSKERTFGEAAKDIAAGVVSGAGSLAQLPGQLYGLATGDFSETGLYGAGKDIQKFGEEMKSAGLKAREEERRQKIKAAEEKGQFEAFKTAFGETIKDPGLLTSFLAEQAPQLLVPFGAAKVAQIGTAAKAAAAAQGLVGEAATKAAAEVTKAAGEKATRAAIGAAAVQQGADVGAQAYEDIYKELIRKGATEADAAQGALNLARAAGASGAIVSLLAQRLPGARTLEKSFAGVPGTSGRLLGAVKGALGEGVSEIAEETGGKFGANLAMREVAPETSLTAGLGATAGMAAIGGVGMGGAAGLARRPAMPEPAPVAPPVQPPAPPVGALEFKPEPLIVYPDGSVAKRSEVDAYIQGLPEDEQIPARAKLLGMGEEATQVTPEMLRKLGIRGRAPIIQRLTGLELTDPKVAEELTNFAQQPFASPEVRGNIFGFLNTLKTLETQKVEAPKTEIPPAPPAPPVEPPAAPPVEPSKVEAPTPPAQPPSAPKVAAPAPKAPAFESKIVSRQPAPDGMEVHVFTTTDGHGSGLFDADAGKYVDGSITRFAGTDTLPKAEARAAEMVRKATPAAPVDVAQQVRDLREQQTKLLTKSGKVPAPRSPARQKYDVLERQIAELEDRQLAVRTQKPRKRPSTIMGSPMLAGIFNQIGGLHTSLLPEFSTRFFTKKLDKKGRPIIMVRNPMIPGYGTLFNKNGKFDFGEIAEHLEAEGYLEPGSLERDYKDAGERAKELVKRALNGEEVLPIEEQIAKDEREREAFERQKALDRQEENRMIASGELQLEPEFEWTNEQFEENLGLDREFETDLEMYNLEPKDLEFLSDEELESELTDAEREQAQARRTRKAEEDAARKEAEGAAPREDEEILTRPTAEGLKAKQEAAEKAAAEEKKAKAAEQERLRKEQQAKEEKARADETVKDFELGKSAEEQMTGMGDLFKRKSLGSAQAQRSNFEQALRTLLNKFGLKDVGLKIIEDMDSAGSYAQQVIRIADRAANPVRTLRHEAIHALRELGFFTDAQWKSLSKMAKDKWIDQYLKQRNVDGNPLKAGEESRYDAYMREYNGDMEVIIEEAVADAFADFDATKPPAGMLQALLKRMKDLFQSIKSALTKVESPEQIFGKVEKGELKAGAREETGERKSLRNRATANFLRWFGDSKVVDEKGEPLVVYHGTDEEFYAFDPSRQNVRNARMGMGFYFTANKDAAAMSGDRVMPVYLSLKNPYVISLDGDPKFGSEGYETREKLRQDPVAATKELRDAGYDGIQNGDTYIAFEPTQIKSAIGNNGEYSLTNADIRKSLGGTQTLGQQALETINRMGMGVKPPEPGRIEKAKTYLREAGENPAATKESAKKTLTKWLDAFETMAFSGDAAFNNKVTSSVIKDMKENPEILGLLLEASQSQAVNADNVVSRGIIEGSIEYNEEMKKWQSVKKDENFSALAKKLDDLAQKYGTTKEEMERIAHTYLVVKRLPGIIQRNNDLDAAIAKEQATAKPDRKRIDEWKSLKVFVSPEQMAQVEPGLSLIKTIPELKEVSDIWQGIRENTIKAMVESGLWSPEYATNMFDNIDYVPYYREEQLEEGAGPLEFIRGLQVKSKEFQLKGSGAPVNDVFDNMIRWSQYAMNRAIRAQKARQMIDAAKDIDIGDRKMAIKVTEEKRGMNIVRVFRNGKQEMWDMADPMFVPAFSAIQNVSIPMFKWAAKVADLLRNSVVLYPMFSVAQVPQDSFAAMFTSGLQPQHALKIPYLAVKEFVKTLAKSSATHNELVKFGVVGARDFSADVMRKDAEIYAGLKPPKGGWGKTKEVLEHIAMAADNAVRQAVYEASVSQGLSKAEALEKAFEIFNVRRRGTSKALNLAGQTIPFFYAYLAAQRVAYRTITGIGTSPTERKAALQTLAATSAAVFTLSMLYAMSVGDDDDYAETPAAVRDRTLTIPGTGGVRIPLRTDFFLFPKIIAEHTYLLLTDKGYEDGAKFRRSMRDALVSAVASPTPLPQVVKPALEVAINYDFFTGKPVIGTFEKQKDLERQFNDSTSELSKLLGKTGLVSPIAVDHFIRGMLGSAGGLALFMTNFLNSDPDVPRPEMSWSEVAAALPGTSGFLKRPQESALKNDFYMLRDEVEKAVNTFNDIKTRSPQGMEAFLEDEKKMARYMLGKPVDQINRQLAKIRRQMTIITNMPENQMSAEDKADNIRQLRELEREYLKSVDVKALREMAKI